MIDERPRQRQRERNRNREKSSIGIYKHYISKRNISEKNIIVFKKLMEILKREKAKTGKGA